MKSDATVGSRKPDASGLRMAENLLNSRLSAVSGLRWIVDPKPTDIIASTRNLPARLGIDWLNGPQRVLAEHRMIDTAILQVPYVAAFQQVGENNLAFDAAMSYGAFLENKIKSKSYSSDGKEWIHSATNIIFKAFFGREQKWIELGSLPQLKKLNLADSTLTSLLSSNELLETYCGSESIYHDALEAETYAVSAKISFWALLRSGRLGSQSPELADEALRGTGSEQLEQLMLREIAYSSHSDQLVLDVALSNDFNVDRKSALLGCYPSTWAALKSSREVTERLLARTRGASGDLVFINSYTGYVRDEEVVEWYKEMLQR